MTSPIGFNNNSQISGFNNNGLLDGFNKDNLLEGLNTAPVLSGINSSSTQNETKRYYPEIISILQNRYAGRLIPGGTAEQALMISIQQMQFNWANRAGRDYYMNDFGVQSLINQIDNYLNIDRMRAGLSN